MSKICKIETDCTGCMACLNVCAHNAIGIEMKNGFSFPVVKKDMCRDCGLCVRKCPSNMARKYDTEGLKTYLCWNKNELERLQSSSGGVFSVIARFVLDNQGVVCGAAYDNYMNLRHVIIDSFDQLSKLQGSKYIQSEIGTVYREIKDILHCNKYVYFTGTPCQVAGLKSFLGREYEKLITSDLICHGVPSNHLFKEQIKKYEGIYQKKIKDFKFRSKRRFGQGYDAELVFEDGQRKFRNVHLIPYFYGFWNNLTLRESCYNCKYASILREGDITLGDFWLVKKFFPYLRTSKGCSLILVNNKKGIKIFDHIKKEMYWREVTIEQAVAGQGQLQKSVEKSNYSRQFQNDGSIDSQLLQPSHMYSAKMHAINVLKTILLHKYWK